MSIKIVTDSSCAIDEKTAQNYEITVVPLTSSFKDKEFAPLYSDNYDEFYSFLLKEPEIPKTTLPAPGLFAEAFKKIIDNGDEVLCITFSSTLSGTYNSAVKASEDFKGKVTVFDSGAFERTLFYTLENALKFINDGLTREQIVEELKNNSKNFAIYFIPDTIDYLRKGGRMSLLKFALASFLKIKPVLSFAGGAFTTKKLSLGKNKAIKDLIAMLPEKIKRLDLIQICVVDNIEKIKNMLLNKYGNIDIGIKKVSPVASSHLGPYAFGVSFEI